VRIRGHAERLGMAMRETAKAGTRLWITIGAAHRPKIGGETAADPRTVAAFVATSRDTAWISSIHAAREVGASPLEWHADVQEVPTTLGERTARLRFRLSGCKAVVLSWPAFLALNESGTLDGWSVQVDCPEFRPEHGEAPDAP
jgi:hypothetical protein